MYVLLYKPGLSLAKKVVHKFTMLPCYRLLSPAPAAGAAGGRGNPPLASVWYLPGAWSPIRWGPSRHGSCAWWSTAVSSVWALRTCDLYRKEEGQTIDRYRFVDNWNCDSPGNLIRTRFLYIPIDKSSSSNNYRFITHPHSCVVPRRRAQRRNSVGSPDVRAKSYRDQKHLDYRKLCDCDATKSWPQ